MVIDTVIDVVPYHTSPWATGLIDHHRSFLLIHALFALADPNVERIFTGYLTFFIDMVYYMQEEWVMLLSSIRDGVIPNIGHIDHVRDHLQVGVYETFNWWRMLMEIGQYAC